MEEEQKEKEKNERKWIKERREELLRIREELESEDYKKRRLKELRKQMASNRHKDVLYYGSEMVGSESDEEMPSVRCEVPSDFEMMV